MELIKKPKVSALGNDVKEFVLPERMLLKDKFEIKEGDIELTVQGINEGYYDVIFYYTNTLGTWILNEPIPVIHKEGTIYEDSVCPWLGYTYQGYKEPEGAWRWT